MESQPREGDGGFYLSCYENLFVLEIIMYHTGLSEPHLLLLLGK